MIDTVDSLIRNAAFMTVTLQDLQAEINENGVMSEYKNGEHQWGTKKSPQVEIYNTMIKNHASITKQLTDLLPKNKVVNGGENDADGFEDFVQKK
jgi:hypothetical protein